MRHFPLLGFVVALAAASVTAADSIDAAIKALGKAARDGKLDDLAIITQTNDPRMAETVLDLINQKRVSGEVRARMTELVAEWPDAPGKAALAVILAKNPRCSDEALLFFSELGIPGTDNVFRAVMAEQRGKLPADFKNLPRVAAAIRGLGRFPEQSDAIVSYFATCLDDKAPHIIRASTAEALGGMKNVGAVAALIPHVADHAIGDIVLRSLYQLTGEDHGEDGAKWQAWFDAQGKKPELKMLTRVAWTDYLAAKRLAAAANPEAEQPDMASFYGVKFRARVALFILDTSGSMTGGRIEKLRGQMSNLLMAMQNAANAPRYGIILFNDGVISCFSRGGIEDKRESSLKKAIRFVESIEADGNTAMVSALRYAGKEIMPGGNVDTIFFLSDGEPSDGTDENVLGMTRELFDKYRVRFNTIEITEAAPPPVVPPPVVPPPPPTIPEKPPESSLLEKMALITGGTYTKPQAWAMEPNK